MSPCHLVTLIGPRGCGKSTVARLLADKLGWDSVDADVELETRLGRSIREVFAAEGEAGFRRHEADILANLSRRERVVIAAGGGAVLREDNRRLLQTGKVIYLTADAETLWRRIRVDPATAERRPALIADLASDGRAEMEQILQQREPLYRGCADLVVDTTDRTPEEIATLILTSLTPDS